MRQRPCERRVQEGDATFRMTTISRSHEEPASSEHKPVRKRPEVAVKALGKRVRQLRTDKGWSQERLADEAGMHRTYMWGIEQGMRNPSVRHLFKLADALGVPMRVLFEEL
jgi:ribosome-binding protein aMBF1 (putative translation factor)